MNTNIMFCDTWGCHMTYEKSHDSHMAQKEHQYYYKCVDLMYLKTNEVNNHVLIDIFVLF